MKESVKRSAKFLAAYFSIMLLGLLLCGSVFMVYTLCKGLVVGTSIQFIDVKLFLHGMFFFAPFVFTATGAFSIFYFIRHKKDTGIAQFFFYILYTATWVFLVPLSIQYDSTITSQTTFSRPKAASTGYFREENGRITFYSYENPDGTMDGIEIKNHEMTYFKNAAVKRSEGGFSDSLIQQDMVMDNSVKVILSFYREYLSMARQALAGGFVSWLCFASIALVFIAITAVRRISCWRLLDVFFVGILYCAELYLVWFLHTSQSFAYLRELLAEAIFFIDGNSLVLCCNIVLASLLFAAGLIISKLRDE